LAVSQTLNKRTRDYSLGTSPSLQRKKEIGGQGPRSGEKNAFVRGPEIEGWGLFQIRVEKSLGTIFAEQRGPPLSESKSVKYLKKEALEA